MTRVPRLKGKELVRLLQELGFQIARTRGSHVILRHPDGRLDQVCCVLFFEMLSCRWKTCLGVFELLFVNQDSVRLGLAVRPVKALKTQN